MITSWRWLTILILSLSVIACSSKKQNDDPYSEYPAEEIYEIATNYLQKKSYSKSIEAYESLEINYPFSDYTEQSRLELIYAYYAYNQFAKSFNATNRFIRLHPTSEYAPYAYYMRGLIKLSESESLIRRFVSLDSTLRDSTQERDAFWYFLELTQRFPNSDYSQDARQRMIFIRNMLAEREINVAKFYIEKQAYLSALSRATQVVFKFQGAPAVYPALDLMRDNYIELDLPHLAEQVDEVIALNSPSSLIE